LRIVGDEYKLMVNYSSEELEMLNKDFIANVGLSLNPLLAIAYIANGNIFMSCAFGAIGAAGILWCDALRTQALIMNAQAESLTELAEAQKAMTKRAEELLRSPLFGKILMLAADTEQELTVICCESCNHIAEMFKTNGEGEECPACNSVKPNHERIHIDGTTNKIFH